MKLLTKLAYRIPGIALLVCAWWAMTTVLASTLASAGFTATPWRSVAALVAIGLVMLCTVVEDERITNEVTVIAWCAGTRAAILAFTEADPRQRILTAVTEAVRSGLAWSVRTRAGGDGPLWMRGEPSGGGYLLLLAGRAPVQRSIEDALAEIAQEVRVRPEGAAPQTHVEIDRPTAEKDDDA